MEMLKRGTCLNLTKKYIVFVFVLIGYWKHKNCSFYFRRFELIKTTLLAYYVITWIAWSLIICSFVFVFISLGKPKLHQRCKHHLSPKRRKIYSIFNRWIDGIKVGVFVIRTLTTNILGQTEKTTESARKTF